MGLDLSHGDFCMAYSGFNRLRRIVAKCVGGSFPPHEPGATDDEGKPMEHDKWYIDDAYSPEATPGIWEFLSHSDCDGEIAPEMCVKVANELEVLLPKVREHGDGAGHIERDGGYAGALQKFIDSCRLAANENEPLEFM